VRLLRDLVGQTLSGRYRLVARLAGGGMGEVFRGHDLLLDRPVAIKILQPSLASDPDLVERFKQEARAAARLNHPNIVSVYDWGAEDDETYYMVMEYVSGTDLREVITLRAPLEPGQAVDTMSVVCDALAAAHASGLVHRDVKPENLLVARDGTVKVTDFGIAAFTDADLTAPGGPIPGTLRYLSPEQARGDQATYASDVWGAGAVLYELLTGTPMFEGTGVDAIQRRAFEEPDPPSDVVPEVPPVLDVLVATACASDPSRRYSSAEEMARELRLAPVASAPSLNALLDDVTGDVRLPDLTPTSYIRQRRRKSRRGPFLAAFGLAFLLVAALGIRAIAVIAEPDPIRVGSVVGAQVNKARARLERSGLQVRVIDKRREAGSRPGEVLSQAPDSGTLEEGGLVRLVVSAGQPRTDIPSLVGLPLHVARVRLHAAELEVGRISAEFSLEEKGSVIAQTPKTGRLEWGSAVALAISRGPRPIEIPDVVGLRGEKAVEKLRAAGFKADVRQVYSNKIEVGVVMATDPPPGGMLSEGSHIEVQVSAGPRYQKVRMPDVRGMSVEAAQSRLSSLGLRVRVEESCEGGSTVVETHPIPGTMLKENDLVALFVC